MDIWPAAYLQMTNDDSTLNRPVASIRPTIPPDMAGRLTSSDPSYFLGENRKVGTCLLMIAVIDFAWQGIKLKCLQLAWCAFFWTCPLC